MTSTKQPTKVGSAPAPKFHLVDQRTGKHARTETGRVRTVTEKHFLDNRDQFTAEGIVLGRQVDDDAEVSNQTVDGSDKEE